MRNRQSSLLAAVLGIAGALLGTALHAQGTGTNFPQILPPNTVVGRLGSGLPGPAQAIPFSSLYGQLALPIVNAASFGVAASTQSTTGNISSGSAILHLNSAIDFQNNQYVRVNGAGITFSTNPPTGLTVTDNGTPGSTHYQYQIASIDANGGIGAALAVVAITNGPATFTISNNVTVSWTGASGGAYGYAIYGRSSGSMHLLAIARGVTSWTDYGANQDLNTPDWLPATPPSVAVNDWLISQINTGGGGTTVRLANTASNTVSGVNINHDDTNPINNALASLPAKGGTVWLSCGDYYTTSTINLGNGTTESSPSTQNGVFLLANCMHPGIDNQVAGVQGAARIHYLGSDSAINVNGPIVSWGLQAISVDNNSGFAATSNVSKGLAIFAGVHGVVRGFSSGGFPQFDIWDTLPDCTTGGDFNYFENIDIFMGAWVFKSGIALDGRCSATDVFQETFVHVVVIPGSGALAQQNAIYLGSTDSDWFQDVSIQPVSPTVNAIKFDYASANNASWPSASFEHIEVYGNAIVNNGTPPALGTFGSQPQNKFIDFSTGNGAAYPFLLQTQVLDLPRLGEFTVGSGAKQLPSCTATIQGQQAYVTDATSPTIGSNVAGGGSALAAVWCNAANWTVTGK